MWNKKSELQCLLIYKILKAENFPRGKQAELCSELTKSTNLTKGSLSAKVSNYKSVAGVNNHSNASRDTIKYYEEYKNMSIDNLRKTISKL